MNETGAKNWHHMVSGLVTTLIIFGTIFLLVGTAHAAEFNNKINLTVSASNIDQNLVNFTVYVNLDDLPDAFFGNITAEGDDMEVRAADQVTVLPHELVWFNQTAKTGELWIGGFTLSSSTNTNFTIYYGNATVTHTNDADTWNSSTLLRLHFQDLANNTQLDSGQHGHNVTPNSSISSSDTVTGRLGNAADFDGAAGDNYYDTRTVWQVQNFSVCMWLNSKVGNANDDEVIAVSSPSGARGWKLANRSNGMDFFYGYGADWEDIAADVFPFPGSTWEHVCITKNGKNLTRYLNGVNSYSSVRSNEITYSAPMGSLMIGSAHPINTRQWNGIMDEISITNLSLTPAWVKAEFINMNSSTTFYSVGTPESSGAVDTTGPTITVSSPTNTTYLAVNSVALNYYAIDDVSVDKCLYELDGSNTSLPGCANSTLTGLALGYHNVKVYANDTSGNWGVNSTSFTIENITFSMNSTNATCAGCNISHNLLWTNSNGLDGYTAYICNGDYNIANQSCDNTLSGNITFSVPHTIASTTSLPTEGQEQDLFKTSDGTFWAAVWNDSRISIWNSTNNGSTWSYVTVVPTVSVQPKEWSATMNSTDALLFSYSDHSTSSYFRPYDTLTATLGTQIKINLGDYKTAIKINSTDALFIASYGYNSGNKIYVNRSTDGGKTWTSQTTYQLGVSYYTSISLEVDPFVPGLMHISGANVSAAQNSADYFNVTTDNTWTWQRISTVGANSGLVTDILVDFNGNRHIFYNWNSLSTTASHFCYYVNSTGGSFSSPINITQNNTYSCDTPFTIQIQNGDIYVFPTDAFTIFNNNRSYFVSASPSSMAWSLPTVFLSHSRYPNPRGGLWPTQNYMGDDNTIEVSAINTSSPFNKYFITIQTSGVSLDNWTQLGFVHFGATGWSNFTYIVNDSVSTNIAYYITANSTSGNSNTSDKYYYTTESGDITPPTINFSVPTPNSTTTQINYIYVNASVSDDILLDTCTLEWNGVNETMPYNGGNTECYVNKTALSDGTYIFKAFVNDSLNNIAWTESRTVIIDTQIPYVNFTFGTHGGQIYQHPAGALYIDNLNDNYDQLISGDTEHIYVYNVTSQFGGPEVDGGFNEFHMIDNTNNFVSSELLVLLIDNYEENNNLSTPDVVLFFNDTWESADILALGYEAYHSMTQGPTFADLGSYSNKTYHNISIDGYLSNSDSDGIFIVAYYMFDHYYSWNGRVLVLGDVTHQDEFPAGQNDITQLLRYVIDGNRSTDSAFINVTYNASGTLDTALLEWDGTNESMTCASIGTGTGYCYVNKTSLSDGTYDYKVIINDTANFVVTTGIGEVIIDTTGPTVSIDSPTNTTYTTTTIVDLNFTSSDPKGTDRCWYTLNGGANTTLTNCNNITLPSLGNSFYTIRVYSNDTLGSIGLDEVNFTIYFTAVTIYAWDEENPTTNIANFTIIATDNENITTEKNTTTGSIGYNTTELTSGIEFELTVSSTGYGTRTYFVTPSNESGQIIDIYLLNSSNAVSSTHKVIDSLAANVLGARVTIYKFINTSWTVVSEGETESGGTVVLSLQTGESYQGIAQKTGYGNTTQSFTLSGSGETITYVLATYSVVDYEYFLSGVISASCTLRNSSSTRNITCTLTDNAGVVNHVNLDVKEIRGADLSQVCYNQTFNVFTNFCNVPMRNNTYSYVLSIVTDQGEFSVLTGLWEFQQGPIDYGDMGIFLTMFLFVTFSLIAVYKIEAGIFMGCMSLIISHLAGFINVSIPALLGVVAVGIIALVIGLKR